MPSFRRTQRNAHTPWINPRVAKEFTKNVGTIVKKTGIKTGIEEDVEQRLAGINPRALAETAYRREVFGEKDLEHWQIAAEERAEQAKERVRYAKMRRDAAQKHALLIKEIQKMLEATAKSRGYLPNNIAVDIVIALGQHLHENDILQMMKREPKVFNHIIQSSSARMAMTLTENRRFAIGSKKNPVLFYEGVAQMIEEALKETGKIQNQ